MDRLARAGHSLIHIVRVSTTLVQPDRIRSCSDQSSSYFSRTPAKEHCRPNWLDWAVHSDKYPGFSQAYIRVLDPTSGSGTSIMGSGQFGLWTVRTKPPSDRKKSRFSFRTQESNWRVVKFSLTRKVKSKSQFYDSWTLPAAPVVRRGLIFN